MVDAVSDAATADAASDVAVVDAVSDVIVDAASDTTVLDAASDVAVIDAASDIAVVDAASDVAVIDAASDVVVIDAASDVAVIDAASDVVVIDAASDVAVVDAPTDAITTDVTTGPLRWSIAVENATGTNTTQLRAVALSHGAPMASVYVGFIQSSNAPAGRTVRRFSAASPYARLAELGPGVSQPKALALDDRGNVFIGYRYSGTASSELVVASADLAATQGRLDVGSPIIGGIAVRHVGASWFAYVTFEGDGLVRRYDVTDPARMRLDASFGDAGSFTIPAGGELRGADFDADGNLWVASRASGAVFRVSPELRITGTAMLPGAFDVAFFDGRAYVSAYLGAASLVRVLDARTMAPVDDITAAEIGFTRGAREGYAGLDIDDEGRLWLADEDYDGASPVRDRLLVSTPLPRR